MIYNNFNYDNKSIQNDFELEKVTKQIESELIEGFQLNEDDEIKVTFFAPIEIGVIIKSKEFNIKFSLLTRKIGRCVDIYSISVTNKGVGVGRKVLTKIEEIGKKYSCKMVNIIGPLKKSIKFYEKLGYVKKYTSPFDRDMVKILSAN
ncbi:MAG: GNAT family N-acetyltransferase [Pseudomonadales bacterium]|nr:GNAT family N-acetyltransferase [Pseudomonadales bacterium]MCB9813545.1 GNAT family N-acetyltransferase [Pseudomonadales bacterium]